MSRFFVNRPIFAIVIAILISLIGFLAIESLPIEQYPDIAPPTINITATYTGASAETVENSVTQIIEQEITGLDGLMYFSSTSSSSGSARISVTFEQGVNPDTAQIQVQNKVQQVLRRLPDEVQQNGVRVTKGQTDFLMLAIIYDETDTASNFDMADYLISNLQDPLSRIEGVGSVQLFGSQYAMRIWLDPTALESYELMPSDVVNAVTTQNVQVSAGKIGEPPQQAGQRLTATVSAQSMLTTPEEFRNIIVKHNSDGAVVRISDVGTVELGSESYTLVADVNGHPAAGLAIQLSSGANALNTATLVQETMTELAQFMPDGYQVAYARDSSLFIEHSVNEVIKTLFEAIFLVVVVMFIFLGSWRTTIIPALTVPVVLMGTFAVLAALGYTINSLTLFAMVLAIGLLVDDTIVVVENVERLMREKGLPAKEATVESMKEVTSSLMGIAVVLSVVFLPMAFFSGATGIIYRQFSVTIITAMVLSVIMAITLAPALCGAILKPHKEEKSGWFLRFFGRVTNRYGNGVGRVLKKPVRWILSFGVIAAAATFIYIQLPTGFLPNEDQGSIMVSYTLPEGADIERTKNIGAEIRDYFMTEEANNVTNIFSTVGFNFSGQGQNMGMAFVTLKEWGERPGSANTAASIVSRAFVNLASVSDAVVYAMVPASIMGLGQTDGFEFQLQANSSMTRDDLTTTKDSLLAAANDSPLLNSVRADSTITAAQLHIDFDREKALVYGISLSDIYDTINTAWAGVYVNDFLDRTRVKRVYIQSAAEYRSRPEDLDSWKVRNAYGEMVPLSEVSSTSWVRANESLERYNGLASYKIQGQPAAGVSSGEAMSELASIATNMGAAYAWSGLSYQEQTATGQALTLYTLSIIVIFLCLAALYESWSIPVSVLMVIPLGILGAVLATLFRGLDNNVYFQVALLAIIGLSAKNAIMMATFMESAVENKLSLRDAAVQGAVLRLRPILMTSLAFVAGVIPLALATGVGANSRIAIGTGIVGGTLTATALALFFMPLFFVLVNKLFRRKTHE